MADETVSGPTRSGFRSSRAPGFSSNGSAQETSPLSTIGSDPAADVAAVNASYATETSAPSFDNDPAVQTTSGNGAGAQQAPGPVSEIGPSSVAATEDDANTPTSGLGVAPGLGSFSTPFGGMRGSEIAGQVAGFAANAASSFPGVGTLAGALTTVGIDYATTPTYGFDVSVAQAIVAATLPGKALNALGLTNFEDIQSQVNSAWGKETESLGPTRAGEFNADITGWGEGGQQSTTSNPGPGEGGPSASSPAGGAQAASGNAPGTGLGESPGAALGSVSSTAAASESAAASGSASAAASENGGWGAGGFGDGAGAGGQGAAGGRVICTELYRQGLLTRSIWLADMRFTARVLSPITIRGYHAWAIPFVRMMRKSRVATWIGRFPATWRAEELAFQEGVLPSGNMKGKLVRLIGEPLCWLIGMAVGAQDWTVLYSPKEKSNG